jgi:hypothetical protein
MKLGAKAKSSKAEPHLLLLRLWLFRKVRKWGGLSLLVTFSLATQRESNSAAKGKRKLSALNVARAKASRTGCAPTKVPSG